MTAMQPADDELGDLINPRLIKPRLIHPRQRPSPKCYTRVATGPADDGQSVSTVSILLLALIASVGLVTVCVASSK